MNTYEEIGERLLRDHTGLGDDDLEAIERIKKVYDENNPDQIVSSAGIGLKHVVGHDVGIAVVGKEIMAAIEYRRTPEYKNYDGSEQEPTSPVYLEAANHVATSVEVRMAANSNLSEADRRNILYEEARERAKLLINTHGVGVLAVLNATERGQMERSDETGFRLEPKSSDVDWDEEANSLLGFVSAETNSHGINSRDGDSPQRVGSAE